MVIPGTVSFYIPGCVSGTNGSTPEIPALILHSQDSVTTPNGSAQGLNVSVVPCVPEQDSKILRIRFDRDHYGFGVQIGIVSGDKTNIGSQIDNDARVLISHDVMTRATEKYLLYNINVGRTRPEVDRS